MLEFPWIRKDVLLSIDNVNDLEVGDSKIHSHHGMFLNGEFFNTLLLSEATSTKCSLVLCLHTKFASVFLIFGGHLSSRKKTGVTARTLKNWNIMKPIRVGLSCPSLQSQ